MRYFLIMFAATAVAVPTVLQAQERREERNSEERTEHAIRACRQAVQQQAANRFEGRSIEFRDARVDPDGDSVVGAVDIPREDGEQRFRFTCTMDRDRDEVRSVQLNPIGEGSESGYRERADEGSGRAMNNCRNAVAGRIAEQGYGRVRIDSMNPDERSDQGDRIIGTARAQRGDRLESFDFACSVELRDGDLRSVSVTRR